MRRRSDCAEDGCTAERCRSSDLCGLHLFWSHVDKRDCWEWRGPTADQWGYGRFHALYDELGERQCNRISYTLLVGPVADGLQLDHLCRNPPCVNPAHLEPVTARENCHRSPVAPASLNSRKTHCKWGHELTPENTYTYATARGRPSRACQQCRRERSAIYEQKRLARKRAERQE